MDFSTRNAFRNAPVGYGGPYKKTQYGCLHGFGQVQDSIPIMPGLFWGGQDAFVNAGVYPPEIWFVKGRIFWTPAEFKTQKNAWHIAAASSQLVMRPLLANKDEHKNGSVATLWSDTLMCMGGKYAELAQEANNPAARRWERGTLALVGAVRKFLKPYNRW
jgi:putative AlgH/UPF0301 family transcriptional regulator